MLLAEDHPRIVAYDRERYARDLFYDRPIEVSLAAIKAARESTVPIIHRMTDAHWRREGTHSKSGRYTTTDWLAICVKHVYEHAEQILRARAAAANH